MKKMKKIRQSFSNAVTSVRRSGSVKIVLEHYDTNLFSGSASVEPLKFRVESSSNSLSTNKFNSNTLGGRE